MVNTFINTKWFSFMVQFRTSINYAKKGHSRSLKTTFPIELADFLGIEAGSAIIWEYEPQNKILVVRKA